MSKRQCYYILETQHDEYGFIPSLVTEHEPGHAPMMGRGEGAAPWYWGDTIERAREICARYNKQHFGISEQTADHIVASSMNIAARVDTNRDVEFERDCQSLVEC